MSYDRRHPRLAVSFFLTTQAWTQSPRSSVNTNAHPPHTKRENFSSLMLPIWRLHRHRYLYLQSLFHFWHSNNWIPSTSICALVPISVAKKPQSSRKLTLFIYKRNLTSNLTKLGSLPSDRLPLISKYSAYFSCNWMNTLWPQLTLWRWG